ncbi:MAG: hypothetical protein AAGF58_06270 [Pseudomonadota bacterium]
MFGVKPAKEDIKPVSISDILPTAVQGLQRQADRVERSAERIARTGTDLPKPPTNPVVSVPSATGSTLLAAQETGNPPPATDEGLVVDLVTLNQASIAYKANLSVIDVADEMARETIALAKSDD